MRTIRYWINWIAHRLFGVYRVIHVEELPDMLEARTLYAVGNPAVPWSVAFLCPCNCGAVIHLTLLQNDSPRWLLTLSKLGAPTLSPSVWRTTGCGSHFFLRNGKIVWCTSRELAPRSSTVRNHHPRD